MQPYPGDNSVLVLDNASIHSKEALAEIADEAGIVIEYLPPYSPDFNPIEKIWGRAKNYMRRQRQHLVGLTAPAVIRTALDHVCTPENCMGFMSGHACSFYGALVGAA
jgi:transposase